MPRKPNIDEYWTVGPAAAESGVAKTTLISAIKAGHIPVHTLGCGKEVVLLADIEEYKANPPLRGNPRHREK